jgi:PAS domain S-box-containing protein
MPEMMPVKPNTLELNLHNLLMQSPFAFAILKGKDSIITLANESIKTMWDKGNDVEGKSLFDVLPEIKTQGFRELIDSVYTTGVPFIGEEMLVKLLRGGKLVDTYFNFTYEAYRELDGTITGVTIIAYEVTTQTVLNQKVKESESYFRLMAELMPEKVANSYADGKVIFYNKSWQDYTGATLEELLDESWEKWIHPEDVQKATEQWLKSVEKGEDFDMELRLLDREGAYKWHINRAKCVKDGDGNVILWVSSNTDIHDQREHTEALEKAVNTRTKELQEANKELKLKNKEVEDSKLKLLSEYSRSLIEASLDPLIVVSTKGRITDMNQAAINVMGKSRHILRGTHFFDYFTEPQRAKKAAEDVFSKGFVTNYPLVIKDHKLTDVLFNGSIYKDEKGKVLGAVIVTRDITEQKRIEKNLIESLKEITDYKYALDASSIVEVTDAQGVILYVNDNFCKISQYTSEEIVGKNHRLINSHFHLKEFMRELWATISTGKIWKNDVKNKRRLFLLARHHYCPFRG